MNGCLGSILPLRLSFSTNGSCEYFFSIVLEICTYITEYEGHTREPGYPLACY